MTSTSTSWSKQLSTAQIIQLCNSRLYKELHPVSLIEKSFNMIQLYTTEVIKYIIETRFLEQNAKIKKK